MPTTPHITFTSPSAPDTDYLRYLWREGNEVVKTDKYKSSALLDFALVPWDSNFVKLGRGSYIKIDSTTIPNWFTGYVTNNPDLEFLGADAAHKAVYGYRYHATSDEFLLSLNPVGILPVFYNCPMGTIIKKLADRLCPGVFNCDNVQDGPTVAMYVCDPTKSFRVIAQDLCEAASYLFYGNDYKLYFLPQDDASVPPVVLDGTDKHYTPSALTMSAVTEPIINDVTVVGQVEPQRYITEYFIGTGLQSAFPLIDSVFGADSSLLIDETFGGSAIDTSKWVVYDHNGQYLQLLNGYLNCLGGSGNESYDVRIQSVSPLPMEGNVRFTHGEWDFVAGSYGVIGALWTGTPNPSFAGCLYGIAVQGLTLNPICNGSGDGSQTVLVSTSKRYCIRTIAQFSRAHRTLQPYSYIDSTGAVKTVTGNSSGADSVTWQTYITEIDPTTGLVTNRWSWTNTGALTGSGDTYAVYVPLASDTLFATVTSITVSIPVNAALAMCSPVQFWNMGLDTWADSTHMSGWTGESADGVYQETDIVESGSALRLKQQTEIPYVAQYANGAIKPNTKYIVRCRARRSAGMTSGTLKLVLDSAYTGGGGVETGVSIPVSSIPVDQFAAFSGVLTAPMASIPDDTALKVYLDGSTSTGESVYVDDLGVTTDWQLQLVGPNEIDAIDGLAPIATIVQPNSGSATSSTYTGAPQYNSGQGQLVFFSDSVMQTSNVPPEGQLVRLTYRGAGAAVGRSADASSMRAEAAAWGDNGVRSTVVMSPSPRPRTSQECELAAAALVSENSYQHYTGTYKQRSEFMACQPRAGGFIQFKDLTDTIPVAAEQIQQVRTTLDYLDPESFIHEISFGKPDMIQVFLNKVQTTIGSFQINPDASNPQVIDVRGVGKVFAPDVTNPTLLSWDDSKVYIDCGRELGSGGLYYEVRYTDWGWGPESGRNLITRTTSRTFSVPRTLRGSCVFIRQFNVWNVLADSEDLTQGTYGKNSATVTTSLLTGPDSRLTNISTVNFSAGGQITVSGAGSGCFSFSAKGPAGVTLTAATGGTPLACPLNGSWLRFSIPVSGSSGLTITCDKAAAVQLTRFSLEQGTSTETFYVKTKGGNGGAASRYSSAIHVGFPPPSVPLPIPPTIIRITTDTTLVVPALGDLIAEIDTTAGPVKVTLPPSSSFVGQSISCVLVTYGSADTPTPGDDATVDAGMEQVPGGDPVQDTYNDATEWVLNKQWQGQEFTGVA